MFFQIPCAQRPTPHQRRIYGRASQRRHGPMSASTQAATLIPTTRMAWLLMGRLLTDSFFSVACESGPPQSGSTAVVRFVQNFRHHSSPLANGVIAFGSAADDDRLAQLPGQESRRFWSRRSRPARPPGDRSASRHGTSVNSRFRPALAARRKSARSGFEAACGRCRRDIGPYHVRNTGK